MRSVEILIKKKKKARKKMVGFFFHEYKQYKNHCYNNDYFLDFAVYVNRLATGTTVETLKNIFSPFNVKKAAVDGGYGFVTFYRRKDRNSAIDKMNGYLLNGKKIQVALKKEKKSRNVWVGGDSRANGKEVQEESGVELMRWEIPMLIARYFTYISKEPLEKIKKKFSICSFFVEYPKNQENSYHENQLSIETTIQMEEREVIRIFGCQSFDENKKMLHFRTNEEADKAMNIFNETEIHGAKISLKYALKYPSLILRVKKTL